MIGQHRSLKSGTLRHHPKGKGSSPAATARTKKDNGENDVHYWPAQVIQKLMTCFIISWFRV